MFYYLKISRKLSHYLGIEHLLLQDNDLNNSRSRENGLESRVEFNVTRKHSYYKMYE